MGPRCFFQATKISGRNGKRTCCSAMGDALFSGKGAVHCRGCSCRVPFLPAVPRWEGQGGAAAQQQNSHLPAKGPRGSSLARQPAGRHPLPQKAAHHTGCCCLCKTCFPSLLVGSHVRRFAVAAEAETGSSTCDANFVPTCMTSTLWMILGGHLQGSFQCTLSWW